MQNVMNNWPFPLFTFCYEYNYRHGCFGIIKSHSVIY